MIRKIESLTSEHYAKQLERQVYVSGRTKADNESIYYYVDKIHAAIAAGSKICFQYFRWTVEKKQELWHNGKIYCISPWALSWDDENYYLVGYDTEADKIKHYRVDKMLYLEIVPYKREGKELFLKFNMAAYFKKVFGMFFGVEQKVKIQFENALAGVVIDRFGKDVTMFRTDEEHFNVLVDVAVSRQFLGWLIALGDGVLDRGERAMQFQFFEQMDHSSRSYEDDGDRHAIMDDLAYMDEDERREALEDMGYDVDDFDDF